jgi:hypothetical protein
VTLPTALAVVFFLFFFVLFGVPTNPTFLNVRHTNELAHTLAIVGVRQRELLGLPQRQPLPPRHFISSFLKAFNFLWREGCHRDRLDTVRKFSMNPTTSGADKSSKCQVRINRTLLLTIHAPLVLRKLNKLVQNALVFVFVTFTHVAGECKGNKNEEEPKILGVVL